MILNLSTVFKHRLWFHPLLFIGGLGFSVNTIASPLFTGLMSQDIFIDEPVADSCTVLAPDIEYNYPQLSAHLFQRHAPTALPSLSQTVQVVCSAPVDALFLTVETDPQSASLADQDPTHFGLGTVNQQGLLGYYQVTLDNAAVDGSSVLLYQTDDPSHISPPLASLKLKPIAFHGWTLDGRIPVKGQQYSVRLTVSPTLNSLRETQGPLVNGGELNGSLVLAFPFGI